MPDTLWGGLEGFRVERNPSTQFPARTAASDGQTASPRAARSAMIRFAVIALSKTVAVGRDHLIHRKRSPFPYEGKDLTPLKLGVFANVGRFTSRSVLRTPPEKHQQKTASSA